VHHERRVKRVIHLRINLASCVRRAGYVASMVKTGIVYTISVAKLKCNVSDGSSTLLGKFFICLKKKY